MTVVPNLEDTLNAAMFVLRQWIVNGDNHKIMSEISALHVQLSQLRDYARGRECTLEELRGAHALETAHGQRWFEGVSEASDPAVRQEASRLIFKSRYSDYRFHWHI